MPQPPRTAPRRRPVASLRAALSRAFRASRDRRRAEAWRHDRHLARDIGIDLPPDLPQSRDGRGPW